MGGFLAALYASTHTSIEKLALLAPAFGFSSRWPALLGPEQWTRWQETGWLEVFHYADSMPRRVHYSLVADAAKYPPYPSFPQPARIFHGVHDPIVPIGFSRAFTANHPNAILTELDDGHELLNALDRIVSESISFLLA
jgi:alpha-beta hydrolase superfamily lysophospholipase